MGGPGSGPRPGQKNRLGTGKNAKTAHQLRKEGKKPVRSPRGRLIGWTKKGSLGFTSGYTDARKTSSKRADKRNLRKLQKKYGK